MMKHVVCFKLTDNSPENVSRAKDIILSMEGKVSTIRDISVGVDFLHSARSYDIILEVLLDGPEVLDEYQNDPYHCEVVKKYMGEVSCASVAVDVLL
ncbi:MAG: Dabb family protein [Clostridiales bacterium]|nr:Dabb family protein [Clostridiales bacterium]